MIQNEKPSQTPKNSTIKIIEPKQDIKLKYKKYTILFHKQLLKSYPS